MSRPTPQPKHPVTIMRDLIWEMELPTHHKLVMLLYAQHANRSALAWPSIATICVMCGFRDERTAQRRVHELVDAGLLEVRRPGGGRAKATVYRLLPRMELREEQITLPLDGGVYGQSYPQTPPRGGGLFDAETPPSHAPHTANTPPRGALNPPTPWGGKSLNSLKNQKQLVRSSLRSQPSEPPPHPLLSSEELASTVAAVAHTLDIASSSPTEASEMLAQTYRNMAENPFLSATQREVARQRMLQLTAKPRSEGEAHT